MEVKIWYDGGWWIKVSNDEPIKIDGMWGDVLSFLEDIDWEKIG